ncbi:MAG: UDP-N-acetylglucosamine 2-epimerase (non-hydrolyzing) [Acidobacteriaceae bacterium]
MRVMTILGTRPEIIRLCRTIPKLDAACEHVLVHTGQNYDPRLSEIFFQELGVRPPDRILGVRGDSPGAIMAEVLVKCEAVLNEFKPDRLLILGDTYSGLSAIVARRMGVPVYHMEAGNRCFDFRVPEEANLRIIDHMSTVLMPYTERSRANLVREGFAAERVYVTGNPIKEVIDSFSTRIAASPALQDAGVESGRYFLLTMHRAENVDDPSRLAALFDGMSQAAKHYGMPIVCSLHPRTRERLREFKIELSRAEFLISEPFGFFDFIHLEQNALCVISDSGTVQEETCILGVPNVTIRDVTERPETVECGSNVLSGAEPRHLLASIALVTGTKPRWRAPAEYLATDVSDVVTRIMINRLPSPRG